MSMRSAMQLLAIVTFTFFGVCSGAKSLKSANAADTFASSPEADWFNPLEHQQEVQQFIDGWKGTQQLHALDMFGVSRAVQRCWTKQGWQAAALDIKIGGSSHDILTKRGFLNFLDHIMMMLPGAICVSGPPCSLFVWISRGTHLRSSSHFDVFGNMALPSVRMSNAILRNFAYLVEVSHRVRPIFWIIEQPMSSQMFDMPTMRSCAALWGLFMVTTWMGCYGHLLQKNTKLLCNLPGSKALKRKMPKEQKKAVAKRRARAEAKARKDGKKAACFYKIDADGRVSGGKDLASSAYYPAAFVAQIYSVWVVEYARLRAAAHL